MNGQIASSGGIEVASGFVAGSAALPRSSRLERRAALAANEVELALTYIFAELSGLAVNEKLFRHDLPPELLDAACVRLIGEQEDESPDFRSFTILFSGRQVTLGAVSPGVLEIFGRLPLHWITIWGGGLAAPMTVSEAELFRPARFGAAFQNGRRVAEFEAELFVRVCTSPPR